MIKNPNFNFYFDETACKDCGGACCVGQSGFIWINEDEINALAKFLKSSKNEVKEKFLHRLNGRFCINEKAFENGAACVFFDEKNKNCSIYEVRPKQCRTFPFWSYYKDNFSELCKECKGILLK